MAKAKSKKITIEDALVPVEGQPYEVPENWCWTYLENLCDYMKAGGDKPKVISNDKTDNCSIPIIANGIQNDGIVGYTTSCAINDETVTVSGRGTIGYSIYRDYSYYPIVRLIVLKPNVCLNAKYLKYIFDYFEEKGTGSSIPQLTVPSIKKKMMPLPPLPEQQRIVEQIESLFSKLDEAREKAHRILDSFEDTWAAITYAAFTGRLTESWRKKNSKNTEWKEYTLQDVCAMKITDGTHQTPSYCEKEDGGVPFISAKDVTSKKISWIDIKYIVPELHEELYARIAPQIDDVLLAKNGTTGVAAIVDTDKVFDIYVTLAVLRPNKDIIVPRYLYNIVNSPVCKDQFDSHLTGIGVPNLHLRDIKDVKIMVPDTDEQMEVVRLVDELWDTYVTAYETAKKVVDSIDIMKKSILAKAFRGELGTNDPCEESAMELLRQIIG